MRRLPALLLIAGLTGCTAQEPPALPQRPAAPQTPAAQPAPPAPPPAPPQAPQNPPPPAEPSYFTQEGLASFYGRAHTGKPTASGEKFDHREFTAAHRTLAFGTRVRVTDLANGRTVTVEITDRGPRIQTRILDLSHAAAEALGMLDKGVTRVRLEAYRGDQRQRD